MKKIIKSLLVPAIFAAGTASALELELRDDSIMKDVELLEKKLYFESDHGQIHMNQEDIAYVDLSKAEDGRDIVKLNDGTTIKNLELLGNELSFNFKSFGRMNILESKINSLTFEREDILGEYDCSSIDYVAFKLDNEVWIRDIDGKNPKQITRTNGDVRGTPTESPNGQYIAFMTETHICTTDLEGNIKKIVESKFSNSIITQNLPWSPDGKKFAYSKKVNSRNYEIFTSDPNGTNQFRLTYIDGHDYVHSWSEDGIKFNKYVPGYNSPRKFIIPSEGGNHKKCKF